MARVSILDADKLRWIHTGAAYFADVQLPSGRRRLTTAISPITIGGHTWEPVTDPIRGRLVAIGRIREPRFGVASATDIVVTGVGEDWLGDGVEGAECDLYDAVFEYETETPVIGLSRLLAGRLSAPREFASGITDRAIHVRIEDRAAALNYGETDTRLTNASQLRRSPGDRFLEYIGAEFQETYKS